MSSFTSNLSAQALSGSRVNANLALVTGEYVNLNLALGYHFNMVDGNLSEDAEKNYAYFRFFGGVTELTRRTRRVRLLAQILEQSDFAVESKGGPENGCVRLHRQAVQAFPDQGLGGESPWPVAVRIEAFRIR
jgi:pyruvate,water dikinase